MKNSSAISGIALILGIMLPFTAISRPIPREISVGFKGATTFDTFDDTIKYDNNTVAWWLGGLHDFHLATKFTPLVNFELQQIAFSLLDSNLSSPLSLWLKADSLGWPGEVLWAGSLLYDSSSVWRSVLIDTQGTFTFSGGEDFWLELAAVGPPYEIYDATQVQPPRSLTWLPPPDSVWTISQGDNFIRAIGEYSAAIVDVGVDSLWHKNNFFLPQGDSMEIGCLLQNYSASAVNFSVTCSLFTEIYDTLQDTAYYEFYSALTPQNVALGAGGNTNLTFPVTPLPADRYQILVSAFLQGDVNPDNDWRALEAQVYLPPAELRYDDGAFLGAATLTTAGDGWGMKFNPNLLVPFIVEHISVQVSVNPGDLPARLQLLDADGQMAGPGTVLWDSLLTLHNGWNDIEIALSDTGAFYIAYLFENGYQTPALRFDGYPASGQGWRRDAGAWRADPLLEDWCLRAGINVVGGPWIELSPTSGTIIPIIGGTLDYNIGYGNQGFAVENLDLWVDVSLPDSSVYGPILGPELLTLPSGYSTTRADELTLSGGAASGTYFLNAYLGEYSPPNNVIAAEDHLEFWKADTGAFYADVGLDTVEHNEHFFVPGGTGFELNCLLSNYSETGVNCSVACSLFTEIYDSLQDTTYYEFYTSFLQQNISLDLEASVHVQFPLDSIAEGRYQITVRALLPGDLNPANDSQSIETQVYSLPAELRYDDGVFMDAAVATAAGEGWSMKFKPNLMLPFVIEGIKVETSAEPRDLAARIQLLDADGSAGAPGTVLWETLQLMNSGWNTFAVAITDTGSFYIAYIFENGAQTAALRYDGEPSSGQGWEKSAGNWIADPSGSDWCLRALIRNSAVPPAWVIVSSDLDSVAAGSTLPWNIQFGNNSLEELLVDIWADINGVYPVLGPVLDFSMPPSWSLPVPRQRELYIAPSVPTGWYTLNGYVGDYEQADTYDEDHFNFYVWGTDVSNSSQWLDDWFADSGEPFEDPMNTFVVPKAYNLLQNFPNPFNAQTTISFDLPQACWVKLAVFDVSGRLVGAIHELPLPLMEGWMTAGTHEVAFDGSGLSSGIYIYRLSAGEFTASGKMLLLK